MANYIAKFENADKVIKKSKVRKYIAKYTSFNVAKIYNPEHAWMLHACKIGLVKEDKRQKQINHVIDDIKRKEGALKYQKLLNMNSPFKDQLNSIDGISPRRRLNKVRSIHNTINFTDFDNASSREQNSMYTLHLNHNKL